MTDVGSVYGNALYTLARDESMSASVLEELTVLEQSFRQEPGFLRLLSTPALSKEERCKILDDSFRGKVQPYVLNFLKILTEKGYLRHFSECCKTYRDQYNEDNGILPVVAVTAVSLTGEQAARLSDKLTRVTGKNIALANRVDPSCLGGVRLEFDGKQLDDTVEHRLAAIGSMLRSTVL